MAVQNEEVVGMVVKLAAESTDFQNQMTTLNRQMKVLQSDYKATASSSKSFDDSLEGNKAKMEYLSKAIEVQSSIMNAYTSKIDSTKTRLNELAEGQVKLKEKLESTKLSYEQIVQSQGEESEAAKKLKEELKLLQTEYEKNNSKINATVKTLDNQTINVNKATEKLNNYKVELNETGEKLNNLSNQGKSNSSTFDMFKQKCTEAAGETKILGVSLTDVIGGFSGGQIASAALGTALGSLASAGITALIQGFQQLINKIGEFITSSLQIGETFEAQMSKVGAISGATAGDMTKLTETAREFGATTQYSAKEAAQALEYMSLAGWDAQQSQDGLAGVLNLAAASAMDLGKASDVVTDYLTAFNMEANEANYLADVMAYAMSHSNTSTEQLAEAYKNCASTATSFGVSLEDTTAWLGKMADSGVKAGEAGTTLNAILARIYGQNESAVGVLEEYGIAIFDTTGKAREFNDIMADMQKAMSRMTDEQKDFFMKQVAGTNQLSGFAIMCNTATNDVNALSSALSNAAGTSEKMANTMNNNVAGLKKSINSKVEDLKISLYTAMEPLIKSVLTIVDTALNAITKWAGPIGNFINGILTPLSTVISVVMRIIQLLQNTLIPLFTGPLSLITSILNVQNSSFKNMYSIIDTICTKIEDFMEPIVNFLKTVGQGIEGICSSLEAIKTFIVNIFNTAIIIIDTLKDEGAALIKFIVSALTSNIGGMVSSIRTLSKAFGESSDEIKNIWSENTKDIQESTKGLEENTIQNFENIADACGLGAEHVFSSFEEMYESIQRLDSETFGALQDSANEYFNEYTIKMDALEEYSSERLQKEMKGWEECHEDKIKDLNYYIEKAEYQAEREAAINRKTAKAKQEIEKTYTSALEQELKDRQATIDSYSNISYTNDYKAFAANEEAKTKKYKEEVEKRAKLSNNVGTSGIFSSIKSVLGAYETGTKYVPYSGSYLVGEKGPEIVNLPRGASVKNNRETQGLLGNETNSILKQILQQNSQNNQLISDLQRTLKDLPKEQLRVART